MGNDSPSHLANNAAVAPFASHSCTAYLKTIHREMSIEVIRLREVAKSTGTATIPLGRCLLGHRDWMGRGKCHTSWNPNNRVAPPNHQRDLLGVTGGLVSAGGCGDVVLWACA